MTDRLYIWHGKYWMFQFSWRIRYSLGVHLDYRLRYVDPHMLVCILTLGRMVQEYDDYQCWWSNRERL